MSGLAFLDLGLDRNPAPEGPERVGERLHEGGGVRVAVVKGGHASQLQLVVHVVGERARLVEVVGRHAEVAGAVVRTRARPQGSR